MASLRAAVTFDDFGFSLNRYPAAVGSYAAHASHVATERWNRLRAWTGGFGRERRIASSRASSQRRATDHEGWSAIGGHAARHPPRPRAGGTPPPPTPTPTTARTPPPLP